ncbi:MAG: hypothetical protein WC693_06195 [Patescibacteria group bacterium]|jgi:hypothetical protein
MLNYNRIFLILATVLGVNLYAGFLPPVFHVILGGGLLILAAVAKRKKDGSFLALGVISITSIIMITGSVFFYLTKLGNLAAIVSLVIIFFKTKNARITLLKINLKKISGNWPLSLYIVLTAYLFYILINAASDGAIASPWLMLPAQFLPLFFADTALLIYISAKKYSAPLTAVFFFLFFSLAAFIYRLGYGFDIFNHEAAVKYILANGTITPKPLQYIGLYSIEIFLHRIVGLPIEWMSRFLLPALTALLPLVAQKLAKNKAAALSLLLLPLSAFIVTAPQGMANLFLLFVIILSAAGQKTWHLALSALLIHPISGLAAFIYLAIKKFKNKKLAIAAGALLLPLAFIFLSYEISGKLSLNFNLAKTLANYWQLMAFGGIKQNCNLWLDLIYFARIFLLPGIITFAIWTAWKYKKEISAAPLFAFLACQISFLLMSIFTDFSYLINYEQNNYSERLFYISFLFLAPYLLHAASSYLSFLRLVPRSLLEMQSLDEVSGEVGRQEYKTLKIFFICLLSFFITANFYLAYPRWDNYENDKGKNVTAQMISAVQLVERDAAGKNYVVLTDQTVSAAALKTYGFKKYYSTSSGEIFYYPIPTGGALYKEFLNLIYDNAGAAAAENARELTHADVAYIILPSYWENADKIKENLKTKMQIIFEKADLAIFK